MSDRHDAKRALSRLVRDDPLDRGQRALADLDRAATFRESGGLRRLRALAATDDERADRAARVLDAFDRLAAAARGRDQFRRGRDTPIRDGGQAGGNDTGDTHR
ncbi:hypothetical protein [Halosegnis marinus]|uniref:Uncharacterized protein n=1 Tax=Halosegnis marinus TaxID=3034023 RepID=A0ABD5ZQK6_9EURY|nr:hypothetical protein [Halosegnis sp. DT85]